MKRSTSVVAACGMAGPDILVRGSLPGNFARALTTALPASLVAVTGDLELAIRDASGFGQTCGLTMREGRMPSSVMISCLTAIFAQVGARRARAVRACGHVVEGHQAS
jgi:hypothetical protein